MTTSILFCAFSRLGDTFIFGPRAVGSGFQVGKFILGAGLDLGVHLLAKVEQNGPGTRVACYMECSSECSCVKLGHSQSPSLCRVWLWRAPIKSVVSGTNLLGFAEGMRTLVAGGSRHSLFRNACMPWLSSFSLKCWCQDQNIELRHGEGTCDFPCSGDESIVCGGFDSFTLYELEGATLPASPTDDNYVGCFADDRHDRVLGAKTSSSQMTSEVCWRTYPDVLQIVVPAHR